MNIEELKHIYFIGIGGIGMSALARFFKQKGVQVSGYDKTDTNLTKALMLEGIDISFKDEIDLIPGNIDLVVYTPAIPKDHKQFNHLKASKIPMLKRSELLGGITKNKFTIAVAGTHGKTTITSMIAHIFLTAGVKVAAFVGGITKNYKSNFIGLADAEVIIVEADEYDRSFLSLSPDISLISSMDADHLDIYHSKEHLIASFKLFAGQLKPNGTLIVNLKVFECLTGINCATYGLSQDADLFASEIEIMDRAYHFNFRSKNDSVNNLKFKIPGRHNLENIIAAISVAKQYGINNASIKEALKTYKGVNRRFDIVVNEHNSVYIDDYAHHPEEINACIKAVREFYPNQKITGVFQPHLFSRTRDFADEFAESLESLDELILLEIYPARELPIEGINSSYLLNKVKLEYKHLLTTREVLDFVEKTKPELLLTIGAGDIDKLVEPLKKRMSD